MDERYLYSCHSVLFLELRRGSGSIFGCRDELSPKIISLHILNGIMHTQDFETLGQSIPDQCVPTLDCQQAVVNHNSYSPPKQTYPDITTPGSGHIVKGRIIQRTKKRREIPGRVFRETLIRDTSSRSPNSW